MIGQIFPLFEDGHILHKEMLEATADYAFFLGELLYEDFSDGIVSGCKLNTTKDFIILNRGILRHSGKLYLIKEPLAIPYQATDKVSVFKLTFKEKARKGNCLYYEADAALSENTKISENQMEMCRFRLQHGAYLRDKYVDFKDRATEFDTLNTLNSPAACNGKSSLLPDITWAFAKEMLSLHLENPTDISFCLQALNSANALPFEGVASYIRFRTGADEFRDNLDLYKGLCMILNMAKENLAGKKPSHVKLRQTIMID